MMAYGSRKAPKDYKESGKALEQIVAIVDAWIDPTRLTDLSDTILFIPTLINKH